MNWFRRRRFIVLQWALFLSVLTQLGAPARAYVAPFPGAVNNLLTETMNARALRMGFVATDPRIAETVAGMGRAAAAIGTEAAVGITAGTAMTWGAVILGAVVVGAGVWYLASDHKYGVTCNSLVDCALALLSGSGHPSLTVGSGYWSSQVISGINIRCSEPSACFETGMGQLNASTTSYVYSPRGTATYNSGSTVYTQPYQRCDKQGANCITSYSLSVSKATGTYTGPECASGASTISGSDASTAKCYDIVAAATKNNAYTLPDSIPGSELGKPADPATMAQVANRLWQRAANTSGYAGIPYSTTDPITAADMTKLQQTRPDLWPTVGDLTAPIAQGAQSGTAISTIPMPANGTKTATDPGYVQQPSTGTNPSTQPATNLGADPGTPAPDATSQTPTAQSIVDPLFDWFPTISGMSLSVPSGSCPTDTLDMWGKHLVLDQHCTFFEQYRSIIAAAMLAVWTMAAAVVLLRA